jgi:CobQ-like glutamine amidotransferase family enzyme
VRLKQVGFSDKLPRKTDIYFMGGGQDSDQLKVYKKLLKKKKVLAKQIEDGVAFLAICGAFQLLGRYFLTGDGKKIEGLGILDIETVAPDKLVKSRCIGNVIVRLDEEVFKTEKMQLDTIVGFENHSGQTYLGEGVKPLGYVVRGFGNNINDKTEGSVYKNVISTYLHGSFLPKNPHIADWLITKALKRKYGGKVRLKKLDDKEEVEAHKEALQR